MVKQTLISILGFALFLSLAACQARTHTATAILVQSPTVPPSATAKPTPIRITEAPPATARIEAPTLPATIEANTSAPVCFMPDEIFPVVFTPDNLRFLVRSNSGVQIFNLRTGEEEDCISATRGVLTAALSPDGQMLAWSLDDNTLQLLRLADHKLLATLEGHQDVVYDLRFSPLGDRLFSGSHDGTVRIWDDNGNQLSSIQASGEVLGLE